MTGRPLSDQEDGLLKEMSDPDFDALNRFHTLLASYDDRGLVLSLAAFAEDTLGRLLLTYLIDGKQSKDLVEGFNAPLGTLATRMKAAFAIGLLTKEQYEDLEIARKIRNEFAHDWEGVSLDRADIQSKISQLDGYTFDQSPIGGGFRERLRYSIANILIELRIQTAQHRKYGRKAPFAGLRLTTTIPA